MALIASSPAGVEAAPSWSRFVELLLGAEAADRAADAAVRESAVGGAEPARFVAGRGQQSGRLEDMVADIALPGLAADLFDQLAGDHVEDVVVGIAAAEAGRRLDVRSRLDRFRAGAAAARHEHQVARAEAEAAAVDQQVADRHLARDPGIVHLEAGQVVDDLVVPAELALVDQDRERRGGERLAGRSGHEDRVGVDRLRMPPSLRTP